MTAAFVVLPGLCLVLAVCAAVADYVLPWIAAYRRWENWTYIMENKRYEK